MARVLPQQETPRDRYFRGVYAWQYGAQTRAEKGLEYNKSLFVFDGTVHFRGLDLACITKEVTFALLLQLLTCGQISQI